jgi:hypothetical protein
MAVEEQEMKKNIRDSKPKSITLSLSTRASPEIYATNEIYIFYLHMIFELNYFQQEL